MADEGPQLPALFGARAEFRAGSVDGAFHKVDNSISAPNAAIAAGDTLAQKKADPKARLDFDGGSRQAQAATAAASRFFKIWRFSSRAFCDNSVSFALIR